MDHFLEDAVLGKIHDVIASVVETESNAYGGDHAVACDDPA
jgi:hypothetical protein